MKILNWNIGGVRYKDEELEALIKETEAVLNYGVSRRN